MFPPFPVGPRLGFPSNIQPPTPNPQPPRGLNQSSRSWTWTAWEWEGDTHPLPLVGGFHQPIEEKLCAPQIASFSPSKGKNFKKIFQTTIQLNISFRNVALARCLKNQKWLLKNMEFQCRKVQGDSLGGVIYAEKTSGRVKSVRVLLSLKFTFSNALLQRSLPILASSFY